MYGKYFENIDTSDKAYILGLLFADGSLTRRCRVDLALEEGSKEILEKISIVIGSFPPTYTCPQINRYSTKGQYKISLGKERENLVKLIGDHKEILPDITNDLIPHFIRGIFDGDGCISLDSQYVNKFPNCAVPGDFYILFNKIDHALQISKILQNTLKISETKIITKYGNGSIPIYKIRWCGTNNLIKIRTWLYKDASLFLEKKMSIFNQIKAGDRHKAARKGGLAMQKNKRENEIRTSSYP